MARKGDDVGGEFGDGNEWWQCYYWCIAVECGCDAVMYDVMP